MSDDSIIKELAKLNKDIAQGIHFGDSDELILQTVSTGIPVLDNILGGGWVRGQSSLIIGNYSSGKTYLAQRTIADAQSKGLKCAFIDIERTYTKEWFEKTGVDTSELIVSRPMTGEEAVDIAKALVKTQMLDILVFDSIAAIAPAQELSKDADEHTMALRARLVNILFRTLPAYNKKTVCLFINQIRSNPSPYGVPESLPGGVAQEYAAFQKVRVKRTGWLNATDVGVAKADLSKFDDSAKMGYEMSFIVEKNKLSKPWVSVSIPFSYENGLDMTAALIDIALDKGIIETKGAGFFSLPDGTNIARGRPALAEFIETNPELKQQIMDSF